MAESQARRERSDGHSAYPKGPSARSPGAMGLFCFFARSLGSRTVLSFVYPWQRSYAPRFAIDVSQGG